MTRNSNFDWLRLFLAGSVAWFHAGAFSESVNGHDVPFGVIPFPMVPTFLALSGFLMLDSFERSASWWEFWRKRALRIFPALVAAILLSGFVWGWREGVIGSIVTYLGGGHLFGSRGNGSLWSLLWEELAYGLMAILVSLGAYRRPTVIWAALVLSCAVAYRYDQVSSIWQVTNLAPGLFVGNLVRMYRDKIQRLNWRWVLVVTTIITTTIYRSHIPSQTWFMVPIGAFLAITLCLTVPELPRLPGDFSYGIYVYHDPIYSAASHWAPQSFGMIFMAGTPCLIGLACLSWLFLERPALKLKARYPASGNGNDAAIVPDHAGSSGFGRR